MSEEEKSTEEEVSLPEEKKEEPTPRFDPEALGQGIDGKNGEDDAIYVDICTVTGF